jgi:hypothetical protein
VETVACPHCGAANAPVAAYCESCGKALPAAIPPGPRILTGKMFATTAAGMKLQADELHTVAKKASVALLWIAVLQSAAVAFLFALFASQRGGLSRLAQMPLRVSGLVYATAIIAAVFWGLYIWSRTNPLPAAIVGLVVYGTLTVVDLVITFSAIAASGRNDPVAAGGPVGGGCGGIVFRVLIISMFVRAINASMRYRELQRHQAALLGPPVQVLPTAG